MRKLALLAVLPLLLGSVAWAGETVSFVNVPSQASAGLVTYNATLTGGYNLGTIDWDGFATAIETYTYGSELKLDLSGPLGAATITLGNGTSYSPGAQFTGTSNDFDNAGDPAGVWTFDFYEGYDDGGDGLPDATWDNIDFAFNDWIPGPTYIWMQDFNAGMPGDWTYNDYLGNGGWQINTAYPRDNDTGGGGDCAAIDSDKYGSVDIDGDMITPAFTVPAGASLEFDHSFRYYSGGGDEQADLDIRVDGGAWSNLLNYSGASFGYPGGEHVSVDLSAYEGQSVEMRFHYYQANYDYWWQVDNVGLIPEPASLLLLAAGALLLRRR